MIREAMDSRSMRLGSPALIVEILAAAFKRLRDPETLNKVGVVE
jgi:hypothetical protein